VLVEPSPQAIVALWVSVEPASVNEKPRLTVLPPRQDTPLLGSVMLKRAVEEEAARQALEVERARGRTSELLTPSYERAVGWLEEAQRTDLRAQDVLAICASESGPRWYCCSHLLASLPMYSVTIARP
jgi:hypothetical protein